MSIVALMDWWVHGVGADRAFKQLVDAGGRSDRGGTHHRTVDSISINAIVVVVVGLGRRKLVVGVIWMMMKIVVGVIVVVVMMMDLVLFNSSIRGRHTLDTIQFHQNNSGIRFLLLLLQKLFLILKTNREREREEEEEQRREEEDMDSEYPNNPLSLSLFGSFLRRLSIVDC